MSMILAMPILLLVVAANAEKPKVEWKPMSVGGLQEIGMLQKGIWKDVNEPFRDEWVDHFGAFFTQEALVNERLRITVGLGGIFQFPKPEVVQSEFGGSQAKAFFIGPTIAEGVYSLGSVQEPVFQFGMGMFPFKYNSEAQNLGEYLFRSGPYPTFITTGGFSLIRNSGAYLQGFKAHLNLGRLKLDGLFYTETALPPLYDWSLAGVASYSMFDGLVDIGAGVNFKRLIQVHPSKSTPRTISNSYFQKSGKWYPGVPEEYIGRAEFHENQVNQKIEKVKGDLTLLNPNHPALVFLSEPTVENLDSAFANTTGSPLDKSLLLEAKISKVKANEFKSIADSIQVWSADDSTVNPITGATTVTRNSNLKYFSTAGIICMGRATIDLKKLLPFNGLGPQDLKIFGEMALLGVNNYEVYYTKRTDRMPMMAGINLPTFRLLDLASVQVEYFHSPYANNFFSLGNAKATPFFPGGSNPAFSKDDYYDSVNKDDFSWSVFLKKEILPGLNLYGQFARDHVRTVGTDWFFGSRQEPNELLNVSKNWYWMSMVSWDL